MQRAAALTGQSIFSWRRIMTRLRRPQDSLAFAHNWATDSVIITTKPRCSRHYAGILLPPLCDVMAVRSETARGFSRNAKLPFTGV